MRNHQVYDRRIAEEPLDEDNPAVAEDGISFCTSKTNKQAKSVKSFWNDDHVVRFFFTYNMII